MFHVSTTSRLGREFSPQWTNMKILCNHQPPVHALKSDNPIFNVILPFHLYANYCLHISKKWDLHVCSHLRISV